MGYDDWKTTEPMDPFTEEPGEECPTCEGRGKVIMRVSPPVVTQDCPSCNGSGRLLEEEPRGHHAASECDCCDGLGWVYRRGWGRQKFTCPVCHGSRKAPGSPATGTKQEKGI